ncbi:TMEM175 family protein [Furfurilactobacillus milii]|uniref:DUF1211 domain-containing protein n=1 Tax=Furfurilactobacillus milii TaxID=2888272 RepID=A0A6N9I1E5_9LACO|nr:TMEM175 family protein [Furfurilactobacillus milii]MYV16668.1 DUF1211 domain-containing protein [Furfurilactobacillus milii]
MSKSRLVAYTDAIIAIIATILVLSLPDLDQFTYQSLLVHWPAYLIYIITFLQLMAGWINHHNLFAKLPKHVDGFVFWTNAIWLLVISFLPYAVKWVGRFATHWQPETFYLLIIILGGVAFSFLEIAIDRMTDTPVKINYWLYAILILALVVTYFFPYFGILTAFSQIFNIITTPVKA